MLRVGVGSELTCPPGLGGQVAGHQPVAAPMNAASRTDLNQAARSWPRSSSTAIQRLRHPDQPSRRQHMCLEAGTRRDPGPDNLPDQVLRDRAPTSTPRVAGSPAKAAIPCSTPTSKYAASRRARISSQARTLDPKASWFPSAFTIAVIPAAIRQLSSGRFTYWRAPDQRPGRA